MKPHLIEIFLGAALIFLTGCPGGGAGSSSGSGGSSSSTPPSTSPTISPLIASLCSTGSGDLTYYSMKSIPIVNPTQSLLNGTTGFSIDTYTPSIGAASSIQSFSISPALPSGLSIDPTTGVISGTPPDSNGDGTLFTVTANYTDFSNVSKQTACKFTYTVASANTQGIFSATATPVVARTSPLAVTLANGKVLVLGGQSGSNYLKTAELYDPTLATFSAFSRHKRLNCTIHRTIRFRMPDSTAAQVQRPYKTEAYSLKDSKVAAAVGFSIMYLWLLHQVSIFIILRLQRLPILQTDIRIMESLQTQVKA